jgi:imidazolonepropionase-like amidohydrolase
VAGIDDVTGSLEPGKHADMIVTDSNPLEDLTTLRHVRHVIRDGVFIAEPHVKRKPVVDRELDKFL